ncbi:MAG: hypothetical protein JJU29_04925 [Verrucomicrobia bacterium]|nr:hypothetical protein [Verrucomicrobiota bacterium]MCH8510248.1 hypothetical protein [Kiritimatiellia bacterium]
MSEHIQPLLDRIHSEGLKKAEAEREALLAKAREEAQSIRATAEREAERLRDQAEKDADATRVRTQTALEQAARDTLLSFRSALNRQLEITAKAAAGAALSSEELLTDLLKSLASAGKGHLALEADEKTAERLKTLLPALLKEAGNGEGFEVVVNPKIKAGFKLQFSEGAAVADVTDEAIASWLSAYLRPEVAKLLQPAKEA